MTLTKKQLIDALTTAPDNCDILYSDTAEARLLDTVAIETKTTINGDSYTEVILS